MLGRYLIAGIIAAGVSALFVFRGVPAKIIILAVALAAIALVVILVPI